MKFDKKKYLSAYENETIYGYIGRCDKKLIVEIYKYKNCDFLKTLKFRPEKIICANIKGRVRLLVSCNLRFGNKILEPKKRLVNNKYFKYLKYVDEENYLRSILGMMTDNKTFYESFKNKILYYFVGHLHQQDFINFEFAGINRNLLGRNVIVHNFPENTLNILNKDKYINGEWVVNLKRFKEEQNG
jgi:hypothetical protein